MTSGASAGQPRANHSVSKEALRARLRAARASKVSDAADALLTSHTLRLSAGAGVVAAYVSRADEPDTSALIEELHRAGVRVLLPVLRREPDWAWYEGPGTLADGPLGIRRPTGRPLGADALALADVVWVPGLAGTVRGDRLGTGGGWYDRALTFARADAILGLLLFDDEVLAELPTDAWDRPVHLLVTPLRVLTCGLGDGSELGPA